MRLLLVIAGSAVAVTILTALALTWAVCQLGHPLYAVAGFLILAVVLADSRQVVRDLVTAGAAVPSAGAEDQSRLRCSRFRRRRSPVAGSRPNFRNA